MQHSKFGSLNRTQINGRSPAQNGCDSHIETCLQSRADLNDILNRSLQWHIMKVMWWRSG